MKKIMAIFAAMIAATTMSMGTSAMILMDNKTNEVFSIEEGDATTTYGVGRLARVVEIYQLYHSTRDFICISQVKETEERLEVEMYLDGSWLSIYAY